MTKIDINVKNPNFWEKSIGKWLLSLARSVATWVIGTSFISMVDAVVLNEVDLSQINWGVAMLGGLCITALYWITVWTIESRVGKKLRMFDERTKLMTAEKLILMQNLLKQLDIDIDITDKKSFDRLASHFSRRFRIPVADAEKFIEARLKIMKETFETL